jgi:nitrite reductase (NO-forming)
MKNLFILSIAAISGMALLAGSCASGTEPKTQAPRQEQATPADDAMKVMMARGEELYKTKCVVCHQADGKGIANAFPPLAGSDYLMADKVRAVAQVLNGSNEEMIVNGQKYHAPMTPQVDTKEDAVAVINYVLNNFGNSGGYVTMEEVKDVVILPRQQ